MDEYQEQLNKLLSRTKAEVLKFSFVFNEKKQPNFCLSLGRRRIVFNQ